MPHDSGWTEQYDAAGWDELVASAGALPADRREWVRRVLAALQEPGQLMAAVIGQRVRYPHDGGEPAAVLIYPNVIVAASGRSAAYLRPGGGEVVDALIGPTGLEQVAVGEVHIVELGPPGRPERGAIEALRSLTWVEVRELPQTGTEALDTGSGEVVNTDFTEDRRPDENAAGGDEASTFASAAGVYPPAGWYSDPHGRSGLRRWDGFGWTDDVSDAPSAESVCFASPGGERPGDGSGQRPATHASGRRSRIVIGVGVLVAAITAASIWAGTQNSGGRHSPRVRATPASHTSPTTVAADFNQTITVEPATPLHDGEVVHIVAKGFTPGVQTGVMECKAGAYDDMDCYATEFLLATADSSGTVTVDYKVAKGPFAAHNVICSPAQPCGILVGSVEGNNFQMAVATLDLS